MREEGAGIPAILTVRGRRTDSVRIPHPSTRAQRRVQRAHHLVAREEGVDHTAGDAHRRRQGGRHALRGEPRRLGDLAAIDLDLTAGPAPDEAHNQRTTIRPGLTVEESEAIDLDADLLAHLATRRRLQRLADLHEAGDRAEAA